MPVATMEEEFRIDGEDEALSPMEEPRTPETPAKNNIERIRLMVEDPSTPIPQISRIISLELVACISEMSTPNVARLTPQKELEARVKALRELQKTLTEGEILSKRDTLDLSGPKFSYVFSEMLKWFIDAMTENKIEASTVASVVNHFREKVATSEEKLRKELNKMDIGR
jgi:hypothetical protein